MGALILYSLEIVLFTVIDRKFYGTYYTPTIFLGVPFYIIFLLALFTNNYLDFYDIYINSLYIWCFGLFFFWITGLILSAFTLKKSNSSAFPFLFSISHKTEKLVLFLSASVAFLSNINLIRGYLIFRRFGGDDFETFLGTGVFAHLAMLLRFLSVFSFILINFSPTKKRIGILHLFVILSALLFCLAYTTKSSLLITLLSGLIARIVFENRKLKIKWIIPLLILAFLVFFISYSVVFGYAAPIDFILQHLLFYFTSSISGLSYYIENNMTVGLSLEYLFMPIVNLFNIISGQPVQNVISNLWTPVGYNQVSNVKTFFGTIYIYGGIWGGIFTTILWSFLSHILLILSRKRNIFFFLSYVIFLSALLFGWFDLYFNTIAFYEFMLFPFIFSVFLYNKQ